MPSHQILAGMVFKIVYCALDRRSIHMHINGRHKNGNLSALFFEVFILYNLFNHHYFPISRSKDYSFFLG